METRADLGNYGCFPPQTAVFQSYSASLSNRYWLVAIWYFFGCSTASIMWHPDLFICRISGSGNLCCYLTLTRSVNFYFTDESEPSLVIARVKAGITRQKVGPRHVCQPSYITSDVSLYALTLFGGRETTLMTGLPAKTVWIKCSLAMVVAPSELHSLSLYHYALHYKSAGFKLWSNENAILEPPRNLQQKYCEISTPPTRKISATLNTLKRPYCANPHLLSAVMFFQIKLWYFGQMSNYTTENSRLGLSPYLLHMM
jgi:hypothetical protein